MNLLLQHWEGPFSGSLKRCQQSVQDYAAKCGVEYRHIPGKPFSEDLGLTLQKIHVLDEKWDEYDTVMMLDMDIWIKPSARDIFAEDPGHMLIMLDGFKTWKHNRTSRLCRTDKPYPAGPLYKFTREERQHLRKNIDIPAFKELCNNHAGDEIIMHYLMWSTDFNPRYIPHEWCDAAERSKEFFHFAGKTRMRRIDTWLPELMRKYK